MNEMVIEFNDIQRILAPFFSGKIIVTMENGEAKISAPKRTLKARGILNNCADAKMISGEKGAWEEVAVEKYTENIRPVPKPYLARSESIVITVLVLRLQNRSITNTY